VAVIGLPDEQWGELLVAVAVLAPSAKLALQELRDFLAATLAR
jgi:acyl-CoA synthetase (AMP-forming)/AMP-acid ligase II